MDKLEAKITYLEKTIIRLEGQLLKALKDGAVAREISRNALSVATEALTKAGAMERSTHKVIMADPYKEWMDQGNTPPIDNPEGSPQSEEEMTKTLNASVGDVMGDLF